MRNRFFIYFGLVSVQFFKEKTQIRFRMSLVHLVQFKTTRFSSDTTVSHYSYLLLM